MLQRFMQVLQSQEDEAMTDVVRGFWTRAKPLPVRIEPRSSAPVVDLQRWAETHRAFGR